MSGSSAASTFEGVTLRAVVELVRAIQASSLRTERQIEKVFSRSAEGFEPVLNFCRRLGMVQASDDSLGIGIEMPSATADAFSEYVLHRLLRSRNRYRSELYRFLRQFKIEDGEVSYASPVPRRSRERACRNFLMEMKLIRYRADRGEHVLSSQHVWVYAAARDTAGKTPPAALEFALQARTELGYGAEVAVMKFEKKRVGPDLAGEVRHIALTNVAAGYDIRSVTPGAGPCGVPLYIEVKAVSGGSFSFYWSQNEVDVAKVLGEHYHLYLLPVDQRGEFDFSALKIVADPYGAVLGSSSDWNVEANVMKCGLASAGGYQGRHG